MSSQLQLQSVSSLEVKINNRFPLFLIIEVTGEFPVASFTNIHLELYFYVTPPDGGIYEFSLTGVPPTDEANEYTEEWTTATAEPYVWNNFPVNLKDIKVHTDQNNTEELLFVEPAATEGLY